MSVNATETVIGTGSARSSLSTPDLRAIVEEALGDVRPGERVLAIIPDRTRDDNTHLLFPMAAQFLARRNVAQFDALVAQGTHGPMTEAQKARQDWRRQLQSFQGWDRSSIIDGTTRMNL